VIEWAADTTGKWTDMQIQLKTGNNLAMVPLKVITTIDATKETRFVYPCPEVSPNSAIYFYEFTSSSSTEKYWTTRFTITDKDGNTAPPTEATQPNGDDIPWGTGMLIGDTGSSPVPSPGPVSGSPPNPSPPSPGSPTTTSEKSTSTTSTPTGTPASTETGVNTGSQSNTNSDMAIAVPKSLVFAIGLITASATLFF